MPGRGRRSEPEPPLGSLIRPADVPTTGTAVCERCGGDLLTRLHLTLADGTDVVFVSCQQCEHRVWYPADGAGPPLTRQEVVRRSARR